MATKYQNLSAYNPQHVPSRPNMKVCIAVAEWNSNITEPLLQGACDTLEKQGISAENIVVERVPGTFELTFAASMMAEHYEPDAVIVLGCVVRGDTPHFDYVCQGVTEGITRLNTLFSLPFIFGVLTTDTMQQAIDRSGGVHGNKGVEAAITAIKMHDFFCRLK